MDSSYVIRSLSNDKGTMWSVYVTLLSLLHMATASETCVCLKNLATKLHNPIHMEFIDNSIYVAEQRGKIIFFKNKKSVGRILLDISGEVYKSTSPFSEQGVLGFTFHPRYNANGRFYVFYMGESESSKFSVLSEFTAVDNYAKPSTERYLMKIEKKSNARNGGQLFFGQDGFLYVSVGDGGEDRGKSRDSAQDPYVYQTDGLLTACAYKNSM